MSGIISYLRRNLSEIVNAIEAIIRLAGSLASLTSTEKDDSVVDWLKDKFAIVKGFLLKAAE